MADASFSQNHVDPGTLPEWMYQQFPTEVLGYAASAYLAGIEVGLKQAHDEATATLPADGPDEQKESK